MAPTPWNNSEEWIEGTGGFWEQGNKGTREFGSWKLEFGIEFRIQNFEFRIQNSELRIANCEFRLLSSRL